MSSSPDASGASVIDVLREAVPSAVLAAGSSADMPTIYVDREHLVDVCRTLRDHAALQFTLLAELTAADYHPAEPRFEVVYHFVCVGPAYAAGGHAAAARRLRIKVRVSGQDARMPTLTGLYLNAGWPEREVYDLFGIGFDGHPDMRRILMPEDWEGHPLRKDYPVQIRKDTSGSSALQMTADEFAANIQAQRDRATADLKRRDN